ncbi:MAG: DUF3365 domain-containing protein [Woeseiaceae bacterium]|nr:DUF3365 domain-containing protein [Woeseiaceae bacterium]
MTAAGNRGRCFAVRVAAGVFALAVAAIVPAADDPLLEESRDLTSRFGAELKSALQAAMAAGGPIEAIAVCKDRAPQIASQLSRESGAAVGRTSLRVRNPRNLPAEWQARVLREFDAAGGQAPASALESLDRGDDGTVRYMKAIPTGGLCTACHGTQISPEVRALLDEHYPHDRARGYEVGDIRGAFSVVWPADATDGTR